MAKEKWGRRFAALLMAAVLLCAVAPEALAQPAGEDEARTVRIPVGINDLLRLDETGQPTGYCKRYLDALARVNNWKYEYVQTTWTQAVEKLENGELDLLFPTNYSPDREATMEFSAMVGGYVASGLFAASDRVDYGYEDFAAFDGARIAVTPGSSNERDLRAFAENRGFTYTPVYVSSSEEKIQALQEGKVDMVIFSAANEVPGAVMVSMLDAAPFYYTVRKGNTELLDQLNQGMQRLMNQSPEMVAETYHHCLVGNGNNVLAFTKEERAFAKSNEQVVVGFYTDAAPLAYVRKDGSCGGVYAELLEYVQEYSGINVVLRPISRDQSWQELLSGGELDFYIGVSSNLGSQVSGFRDTDPFLTYDNVLVTRNDCVFDALEAPVIAVPYGRDDLNEYLPSLIGSARTRVYRDAKECLLAVRRGEADGAVLPNIEFNYQSQNARFDNLIQRESYRFTSLGGLTASVNGDDVKFSAINKALGLLSTNRVDSIVNDNINMPYAFSFRDRLYNARYGLIIAAVTIVFVAVIWIVRRRQKAAMAEAEAVEARHLRILAALSRGYNAIYYTQLDRDHCEVVQLNQNARAGLAEVAQASHSHSQTLGRYIEEFVAEEYRDALMPLRDPKEVIRRLKENPEIIMRYCIKPNEKGEKHFELHIVDVSEPGGEHAMVFAARCVDELVRAEGTQKQLLQDALAAANKASSAKTDFLSKMSHDIRTPMNAIIGMTAIATAHLDDTEKVRDALGKISASSRYLLGLINEVLDMSKIESGAISLREEAFNLSELLNNILIMIQPQIKEHSHHLSVNIQDIQHEDVLGDSLRIQQVFMNIIGNAVKYTPDGGQISLSVREKPIRTPKVGLYEFVFKDSGIGMSKEFLEHIFEPFTRAEDLRVSKIQGTGLGMPIAQNIVKQMNGDIQVDSEVGKGSTFTVTVCLKLQDAQELDATELAGLPVLVVDDNVEALESVCDILEQIGMRSKGCDNGQDAVEEVRRTMKGPNAYYAAILDWKMPGMDGVATARAIKRLMGADLPVAILSAYDWTDIEQEARAAGVDAFLSKPIFKSSLIRLFKRLRQDDQQAAGAPDQLQDLQESDYSGQRVLLVEDNDLNREIAREILEMSGLEVEEAENGKEAVDRVSEVESGYYSMILMDIQMPIMSGYEATMAIRALGHSDSRSIPIIAMTANAFVEDIQAAKTAGMNEHLAKPIDFDKLSKILKKYLG